MRVAGVPMWAIVLVACVVAPWLIRLFVDAEQRRAKKKTTEVLQGSSRAGSSNSETRAAGPGRAASIDQENG